MEHHKYKQRLLLAIVATPIDRTHCILACHVLSVYAHNWPRDFPTPPGGGKAVDSEKDGEAVSNDPPVGGGGGFLKSKAMLNSSPPALDTPQGDKPRPQPP